MTIVATPAAPTPMTVHPGTRSPGVFEKLCTYAMFRGQVSGARADIAAGRALVRSAGAPGRKVFTFTSEQELTALGRLALMVPRGMSCLEIGSYLGASSRYLAAGLSRRGGLVYCVDTWNNETMPDGVRDTYAEFIANLGSLSRWVVPVRKRSEAIVPADVPAQVGLVFIDGDHSYEACRRDFDIVQPFLNDQSVIAFHDSIQWEGVSKVIGEVLAEGRWALAGLADNLLWVRRSKWTVKPTGG